MLAYSFASRHSLLAYGCVSPIHCLPAPQLSCCLCHAKRRDNTREQSILRYTRIEGVSFRTILMQASPLPLVCDAFLLDKQCVGSTLFQSQSHPAMCFGESQHFGAFKKILFMNYFKKHHRMRTVAKTPACQHLNNWRGERGEEKELYQSELSWALERN